MAKRATTKSGPIDLIEAVYDLESDDESWLRGVVAAAVPSLDDGFGVMAYAFDLTQADRPRFGPFAAVGQVAGDVDVPLRVAQALGPADARKLAEARGAATAGEALGLTQRQLLTHPVFVEIWHPRGYRDFRALNATDPLPAGVMVGAPQRKPFRHSPASKALWDRVSAHLAAAARLRRVTEESRSAVQAVLTPAGRCEHAEDDARPRSARAELRAAALAMDRARGKLRRTDAESATELWQPLVSGRWTLVDRFEEGGRRYLVARVNAPTTPGPTALEPRERQVVAFAAMGYANKWIAWELGVTASRVGALLSTAARKLGVRSRVELVEVARVLRLPRG